MDKKEDIIINEKITLRKRPILHKKIFLISNKRSLQKKPLKLRKAKGSRDLNNDWIFKRSLY